MLEREFALVGEPSSGVRHDDVLLLKRGQRRPERLVALLCHARERSFPKTAPDDRRVLHEPPLERRERVESSCEQSLNRFRQLRRLAARLLGEPSHHLHREERVAARSLCYLLGGQEGHDELARLFDGERVEQDRGAGAPASSPRRPAVQQLVPREAKQQQRLSHPLREVLDQVEHSVVSPMNVLEGEDQRGAAGHALHAGAHRGEEALAHALRILDLRGWDLSRRLDAEQAPDQRSLSLTPFPSVSVRVLEQVVDRLGKLAPRDPGIVDVDDAGFRADHLAQRPVHDSRPVRRTVAFPEGRLRIARCDLSLELQQQPRLPDSGLTDDGDEMWPAFVGDT